MKRTRMALGSVPRSAQQPKQVDRRALATAESQRVVVAMPFAPFVANVAPSSKARSP